MSKASEASEAIKTLESIVSGYMIYDTMVGGLVSEGLKTLVEMRELLRNPTIENVQDAITKFQGLADRMSPYAADAPDVVNQANLVMEKLRAL